jgi:hypothetical protein
MVQRVDSTAACCNRANSMTSLITENGGAFPDPVQDGQVHDADRTHYLPTTSPRWPTPATRARVWTATWSGA